jgi:thiol-disulfide isomerase/thioredoxin
MLTPDIFRDAFSRGLPYADYIATAKPRERPNWDASHARIHITEPQRTLLNSFTRRINILTISGTWCGDCVQQCPMLDHVARAASVISLRFLDRDANQDIATPLSIAGGLRVPTVVFLNEDFEFVSLLGDRTLTRYRRIAAAQLGAACPLPGAPLAPEETAETLQDWINEFERVHLLLRLSPKLRARYAD